MTRTTMIPIETDTGLHCKAYTQPHKSSGCTCPQRKQSQQSTHFDHKTCLQHTAHTPSDQRHLETVQQDKACTQQHQAWDCTSPHCSCRTAPTVRKHRKTCQQDMTNSCSIRLSLDRSLLRIMCMSLARCHCMILVNTDCRKLLLCWRTSLRRTASSCSIRLSLETFLLRMGCMPLARCRCKCQQHTTSS
jgi:hypothetical protein